MARIQTGITLFSIAISLVGGLEAAFLAPALIVLVEEKLQAPVITFYRIGKVGALFWVLDLNLSEGILLRPLATMFMRREVAEDGGVVQVGPMTIFQAWERTEAPGAAGLPTAEDASQALGKLFLACLDLSKLQILLSSYLPLPQIQSLVLTLVSEWAVVGAPHFNHHCVEETALPLILPQVLLSASRGIICRTLSVWPAHRVRSRPLAIPFLLLRRL